jgi:hypothetical protein
MANSDGHVHLPSLVGGSKSPSSTGCGAHRSAAKSPLIAAQQRSAGSALVCRQEVHVDFQDQRGHGGPVDLVRPDRPFPFGRPLGHVPTAVGVLPAQEHLADLGMPVVPPAASGSFLTWYTACMSQIDDHPAARSAEQILAECDVRRLRRSGPGGQHRNKVETAVSLHHIPTGARAEASERRSQAQNRSVALFRLRVNLALEVRRRCGSAHVPSPLWQSRCGGGLKVSASHDDFPALLAEALDVLAALDADPKRSAATLGCTPSQLVRLLKLDSRALLLVNEWRKERQLHALR